MTDEELRKIGDIVGEQLIPIKKSLDKQGRDIKILKSDVGALKSDVGSLKGDVKTLKEDVKKLEIRIESVDKKVDKVSENLERSIEDNADFFQEVGLFIDKTTNRLEERLESVEKHLGFPKSKN